MIFHEMPYPKYVDRLKSELFVGFWYLLAFIAFLIFELTTSGFDRRFIVFALGGLVLFPWLLYKTIKNTKFLILETEIKNKKLCVRYLYGDKVNRVCIERPILSYHTSSPTFEIFGISIEQEGKVIIFQPVISKYWTVKNCKDLIKWWEENKKKMNKEEEEK